MTLPAPVRSKSPSRRDPAEPERPHMRLVQPDDDAAAILPEWLEQAPPPAPTRPATPPALKPLASVRPIRPGEGSARRQLLDMPAPRRNWFGWLRSAGALARSMPFLRQRKPVVKLIALDLDGTLLDSQKRISGRTVRALKSLEPLGVKVVIASARPPRSCRAIYKGLGLDTWQINYNGALVWDPGSSRSVFHWPMDGMLVHEQIRVGRQLVPGVQVAVEIVDRWYTDRVDPYRTTVTGRMFKPDVVAPLQKWSRLSATKLMFLAEPRKVARIREGLRDQFGHLVKVVHADPDLVQVMSREAGKDIALRKVADFYGIPVEHTLAVGDALNDVDMLRAAGTAVCVSNGCAEAKAISHWVAPSNDDHGVYETILRYFPQLRIDGDASE